MSTALSAIRQDIAKTLDACLTGAVDSATTTTVTDADLIDTGEGPSKYNRWWLYLGSGTYVGEERRVTTFAQTTGQLTVGRAFTGAASAADTYELHKLMSVPDWNRHINRTLTECWYDDAQEIAVVSNQRQYPLTSYTFITKPSQIWDVEWRQGDTANEYRYLPMDWYSSVDDSGTITINIRPTAYASGQYIRLRLMRPYAELATDAATTDCPLDWVRAGTIYHAYEWLARGGPAEDTKRYSALADRERKVYMRKTMYYTPMHPFRIQHADSPHRATDSSIVTMP